MVDILGKVLDTESVEKKAARGFAGRDTGEMTELESIVLTSVGARLEDLQNKKSIVFSAKELKSEAETVNGIVYGCNKILVALGRSTGLGLRADGLSKGKAKEVTGEKLAVYIHGYGEFNEEHYASEPTQGDKTSYEEPSGVQVERVKAWAEKNIKAVSSA